MEKLSPLSSRRAQVLWAPQGGVPTALLKNSSNSPASPSSLQISPRAPRALPERRLQTSPSPPCTGGSGMHLSHGRPLASLASVLGPPHEGQDHLYIPLPAAFSAYPPTVVPPPEGKTPTHQYPVIPVLPLLARLPGRV